MKILSLHYRNFIFFISFAKLEVFLIEKIYVHSFGNISFHVVAFVDNSFVFSCFPFSFFFF